MEELLQTLNNIPVPATTPAEVAPILRRLNDVNRRTSLFVNRTNATELTKGFLQSTLMSVKGLKERLSEIEDQLIELDALPTQHAEAFSNRLFNLDAYLNNELARITTDEQHETLQATQLVTRPHRSEIKLPDLPMPNFDGTPKKWIQFRRFVTSSLENNPAADNVKLIYLSNSLNDEGKSIVASVDDTLFKTAWDALKKRYDNDIEVRNELLDEFYFLLKKLDTITCQEFEKQRNPLENAKTADLITFLKVRVRVLNVSKSMTPFKPSITSTPNAKASTSKAPGQGTKRQTPTSLVNRAQTHAANVKDVKCPMCSKEGHFVYACPIVNTKSVDELKKLCSTSNLCFNCMRPGHVSKDCLSLTNCRKCNKRHHTLLHTPSSDDSLSSSNDKTVEETPKKEITKVAIVNKQIAVLATAVVLVRDSYGNDIVCRAFLDSGSTVSFMTADLASNLRLRKQPAHTLVDGINGSETVNRHQVTTMLSSRRSDYSCEIDFLVTKKITGDMPRQHLAIDTSLLPPEIQLADPAFDKPGKIDLLLGADIFFDILNGTKLAISDNLWAYPSLLGHLIVGKLTPSSKAYTFLAIDELRLQLQSFWEIETLINHPIYSIEEKAAEKHFVENVKRRPDMHYEVALPLKANVTKLGDSSTKSRSLFIASEKRLARNPEKQKHYQDFINEMMSMGHLTESTPQALNEVGYFMTHHLISRPSSTTTKHRVVFNASFKTTTGLSLNDVLMVGPSIQADLFVHLLRWRKHLIALTADVEKMYRMIFVRTEDQNYQRIWWRHSHTEELKAYQIATVTYGTSSAPFQATRVLKQLAEDESLNFPDVISELEHNFYMDDYSSSTHNLSAAMIIKQRLVELLSQGGFNLRKWQSNEKTLEDQQIESHTTSVLGVSWNKEQDTILIDFSHIKVHEELTKCSVLSEIAQFFDPLGLVSPVIIMAKMFMQKLWLNQLTWDEPLNEQLALEWLTFRNQLISAPIFRVSRALITSTTGIVLHGFGDASSTAYGACIYLVNNGISTLVCAKSRVAPLKTMTIPRLELSAALLLAQMMKRVVEALNVKPDAIYYWTDNEITYYRIHSTPGRFTTFVATRVAEIQSLSSSANWNFIPGELNPADIVSRGMPFDQLINCCEWWHGPEFIYNDNISWPTQKINLCVTEDDEIKTVSMLVVAKSEIELQTDIETITNRFSNWQVMIKVVVHIIRFFLNTKTTPAYRIYGPASIQERLESQLRIVRSLQQLKFGQEMELLSCGKQLPSGSKLSKLTPFIDEDGLLRVGGRLNKADLTFDHQHQIVVPKSHISYLILEDLHRRNMHAGPQALLAFSRQRYWIHGGRTQAKQVVHNCLICFKSKPKLLQQIMAGLHKGRTQCKRAFDTTGVDLTGLIEVKPLIRTKTTTKCYVCLFTCFATRAVHLEIVHDLTSISFLNALRRFIARRGIPSKLYSDNATNFIGGRNDLKELRELMLDEKHDAQMKKLCDELNIQWLTIPTRSPHWGGLWESMIKQFKHYFNRCVPDRTLHIDELETLVIQVEAILNSRPLTPITDTPDDFKYLTPGHFLIGQPLNLLPEPSWRDETLNRLESWQIIQRVTSEVWERFRNDYINELQRRNKWKTAKDDVKIGTMVIMYDDLPPTKWRLGRISDCHTSTDGHVRAVTVDTDDGQFTRAINKVAPLPFENN